MSNPEEGLYVARVTEDGERRLYADEDTVCDHQTQKIFEGRNKAQEAAQAQKQEDAQRLDYATKQAEKQAKRQKRCRNRMITDVTGFVAAAGMAVATYVFGIYVLIAVVTGCTVAAVSRVVAYASAKGGVSCERNYC